MSNIITTRAEFPSNTKPSIEYLPYKRTYCGIDLMGVIADSKQNPQYTGPDARLKQAFFDLSKDPIGYSKEDIAFSLELAKKIARKYLSPEQIDEAIKESESVIEVAILQNLIKPGTLPERIKRFYVTKDILATEIADKYGEEIRIDALIGALIIPDPYLVNYLINACPNAFIQVVSENDPIVQKVIMKSLNLEQENVAIVSANQKVNFLTEVISSKHQFKVCGLIDDQPMANDQVTTNNIFVCDPIYVLNYNDYKRIDTRKLLASFVTRLTEYSEMAEEQIASLDRRICLKQ